jgi:hypothetical protein
MYSLIARPIAYASTHIKKSSNQTPHWSNQTQIKKGQLTIEMEEERGTKK